MENIKAIVYTSNTGSAESYAKLLSQETGLPTYSLKEASKKLANGSEIIYIGWVMASNIKGYNDAVKKFNVQAVCGVGMSKNGTREAETREINKIPENIPLFIIQGNFNLNKLKFPFKTMMKLMIKGLTEKPDKTPDEEELLDTAVNCKENVCVENLKEIIDWYSEQN